MTCLKWKQFVSRTKLCFSAGFLFYLSTKNLKLFLDGRSQTVHRHNNGHRHGADAEAKS